MECSGVSSMSEPSRGDLNATPRSVISARCSSDTICDQAACRCKLCGVGAKGIGQPVSTCFSIDIAPKQPL